MMDENELQEAFRSHLRGEWPSKDQMAAAPILSNWKVDAFQNFRGEYLMILTGNAEDHPILGNCEIKTSPLLWIDKDRRVARTMSRLYALGSPAADVVHP
jgi:hypothetical protein